MPDVVPYKNGGICACTKPQPTEGGPYKLKYCGKCGHLLRFKKSR